MTLINIRGLFSASETVADAAREHGVQYDAWDVE